MKGPKRGPSGRQKRGRSEARCTFWGLLLTTVPLAALVSGCISASPAAEKVRLTTNPEVVRGCQFLGNVRATSGWAGGMSGVAAHNTEVTLREKTAKLEGNVVFVTESGIHAVGEAYRCEVPKP